MSTLKRHDGELEIDLRAGDGIPADMAHKAGMPGLRGGGCYHFATMWCHHCGTPVLLRHDRVRPREYCRTCDGYICDFCARTAAQAGYVHMSHKELCEKVQSGKWTVTGSASAPMLIPISKER